MWKASVLLREGTPRGEKRKSSIFISLVFQKSNFYIASASSKLKIIILENNTLNKIYVDVK